MVLETIKIFSTGNQSPISSAVPLAIPTTPHWLRNNNNNNSNNNNNNNNIQIKEAEKLSKHKDMEIEGSRLWKVRSKIVPVAIRTLGTIKKGLDHKPQLLPGQRSATATEGHTNEHCTEISGSAGVNRFDLWLRFELTEDRHLINNWR